MRLNLNLDAVTSKYRTGLNDRSDSFQRGYALLDATVATGGRDDSWEVALIGNNLTNTRQLRCAQSKWAARAQIPSWAARPSAGVATVLPLRLRGCR